MIRKISMIAIITVVLMITFTSLFAQTNKIVETSSDGLLDISLLSSFFDPIEQFYGDVKVESVAYYDNRTKHWSDFKDCEINISIDYQTNEINLSGEYNVTYKITSCPNRWSVEESRYSTFHSIDLECASSAGESVLITFMKPQTKGDSRHLLVYPSNNVSMSFTIKTESRSILKSNYEIHPAGDVNYMFYKNMTYSYKFVDEDGESYDHYYYGLVKCSGQMPICITGLFTNFYWETPQKTNNLVIVEKKGKWGAIDFIDTSDTNGVYGIPFIYDSMEPFRGGKSNAVLNGNKTVVLATDKIFMPFSSFLDNNNPVDTIGETILKDGHQIIPGDAGRYIAFKCKDKIGFAQNASDACILLYPQYDKVNLDDKYMILVSKDGKWGAIPKWILDCCGKIPDMYHLCSSELCGCYDCGNLYFRCVRAVSIF